MHELAISSSCKYIRPAEAGNHDDENDDDANNDDDDDAPKTMMRTMWMLPTALATRVMMISFVFFFKTCTVLRLVITELGGARRTRLPVQQRPQRAPRRGRPVMHAPGCQ